MIVMSIFADVFSSRCHEMMSSSTVVSLRHLSSVPLLSHHVACHRYLRVELRHVSRMERVEEGRGELLRGSRRLAGRQNQGPPDAQHRGE